MVFGTKRELFASYRRQQGSCASYSSARAVEYSYLPLRCAQLAFLVPSGPASLLILLAAEVMNLNVFMKATPYRTLAEHVRT